MTIWAISDLHLSLAKPDRRERFAGRWREHAEKLEQNWREIVRADDLVLLPGDLSMARNHRELQPDLAWLERLPGTKILSAGNHDVWWNRTEAIRPLMRKSMRAVGGDALATHGIVICGARGAPVLPDDPTKEQREESERAIEELDRALADAARLRTNNEPLYVLWHFPPFDAHKRPGACVERFEPAGVTACVYGHLHIESQWPLAVQGEVRGVRYHCVAADAVGFRPLRVG